MSSLLSFVGPDKFVFKYSLNVSLLRYMHLITKCVYSNVLTYMHRFGYNDE